MKTLAVVTAAGALSVGGASAAMAADGASADSGSSRPTAAEARRHPGVRHALRGAFAAAAETLGMTPQELHSQVVDGHQSIGTVAGDQLDAVKAAMVASLSAAIDQGVANGRIPADRAETAKSRLPQVVDRIVNRVPGARAQ